jgi:HAE1 family hydrophobic/amphiphilic exporter-1
MDSVTRKIRRAAKTLTVSSLVLLMTGLLPVGTMARSGDNSDPGNRAGVPSQEAQPSSNQAQGQPAAATPATGGTVAVPQAGTQQQAGSGQDQSAITKPLAQSPEVGHERVGVNLNQVVSLRLAEAIQLALQNNLDIENFRQGVQIAQYNLFAARGFYDMVSGSTFNYRNQTQLVSNIFAGGGTSGAVTSHLLNYNFTDSKQVEQTGASVLLEFDNLRQSSNSSSATLTPTYQPLLQLTVTQPLLRNRAIDANRRNIMLLKKSLDMSDSAFRQRVIEIINLVQDAYWELVFAITNDQIARKAVELAQKQLDDNRKMVEAGTLAPIELRSNEAQLEANKGLVIAALQTITTDENALKTLLLKDPNDRMWNSVIDPVDQPVRGQPTFSVAEATNMALKNRPELEQQKLSQQQNQINVEFFKNQTKPQLDFLGIFNTAGLAGTLTKNAFGTANPPSSLELDLVHEVNRSLIHQGLTPFSPSFVSPVIQVVPDVFNGGYGQSLRNLFSFAYPSWQVGVVFSFPWHNRTAEGNLGSALASSRQLDAQYRSLVQSISVQVRNALQAVDAAFRRYQAAQANTLAAKAQYEGEQEKFRAGLSQNFLVLQRQNDLAIAEGNQARAQIDYNKALADLQHVTGITLVSNNVQVPPSADTSKPGVTGPSTRISN